MDLKNLEGVFCFVDASDVRRKEFVWGVRNARTQHLNERLIKSRTPKKAKGDAAFVVLPDGVLEAPVKKPRKKRVTKQAQKILDFLASIEKE